MRSGSASHSLLMLIAGGTASLILGNAIFQSRAERKMAYE
jgi:hypothetical protein